MHHYLMLLLFLLTTCLQASPPAFEKIYIQPHQLCTFYNGTFLYDDQGESIKVGKILFDEDGMYMLSIQHECPLCGRYWEDSKPGEGYGCPIFKREYRPGLWLD